MGKNILLLLALIVGAMTACSGSNSLSNLAMGTVDFQGSSGNPNALSSSTFTSPFSNPFAQIPSVAFGIWDANFGASSATQFSQFSIQVSETKTSSVKFVFSHKSNVWTSIKIGFWATTRPDLTIGTSSADFGSLVSSNTLYNVTTSPIMNYQRGIVRAFINGFSLNPSSTGINIRLDGYRVDSSRVSLAIGTGSQTNLKKIYFSYLAFSPSQAQFASYGGSLSKLSFSGVGHENIRNLVHYPQYVLQGINKVISKFQMAFSTSIDKDFIYTYNIQTTFNFVFNYILIGPQTKNICSTCNEKYAYDEQCIEKCPANTYQTTYNAGGLVCVRCSSKLNLVLNSLTNKCQCAFGYTLENNICQKVQTSFSSMQQSGFGSFGANIIPSSNSASTTTTPPISSNIPATLPTTTTTPTRTPPPTTTTTTPTPIATPAPIPTPTPTNINSYPINVPIQTTIPQVQPVPQTTSSPTTQVSAAQNANNAKSCAQFLNSYWTGYRCACRVGYRQSTQTGQCERIGLVIQQSTVPVPNVPNPANCGANANFNGITCVCNSGYIRNNNNECVYEISCPQNSQKLGDACICNSGYIRQGDLCVKITQPQCGANSFRNSIGICVCNTGYIKNTQGNCVLDNRCPTNQIIDGNGVCICLAGFYRNQQKNCVRCEGGAIWSGSACVFPCGIQQVYNQALKRCECRTGYGKFNGICQICSGDFFLSNGYCVTCPINSEKNEQGGCSCISGYSLFNGFCTPTCDGNKVFSNGRCVCREGLGLINANTCGICPQGQVPNPNTQICGACPTNQVLSGGRCICREGYGFLSGNTCAICKDNGRFLLSGYCVTCPIGQTWNGQQCSCPVGSNQQNGQCVAQCKPGQIIDASGFCYTCPLNQVVSNGQCVCKTGYQRNTASGFCALTCAANQYLINGRCATCVLNTVYSPSLKACVCPSGTFTNTAGVCEVFTPPPVECKDGQYYSSTSGCLACPAGCKTCENSQKCTSCLNSAFIPNGATCVLPCGNGKKDNQEQCDDTNTRSGDGCSSTCKTEFGWTCNDFPSRCVPTPNCGNRILNSGQTCDDGNTASSDGCSSQCQTQPGFSCNPPTATSPSVCRAATSGMKLDSPIIINNAAVYGTVLLDTAFTFNNQSEMQNFMQYTYQANARPTANYCNQRPFDLLRFDCFFLYPSGVPLFKFNIGLSYNRNGKSGQLSIEVDSTKGQISTRSIF